MNDALPKIDATTLQSTKSYLQDIARVIGKAQQTYLSPEAHDWHRGLEVADGIIATKSFPDTDQQIVMDLGEGIVQAGTEQWALGEVPAPNLLTYIDQWLAEQGITNHPEQPEYTTSGNAYDKTQAGMIGQVLPWAKTVFEEVKQNITTGVSSPVLLYPHHFDVSLTWFPYNDNTQLGFGFSFGDEYIAEPYFYVTAYPEPKEFGEIDLAPPASWFNDGFHGAILRYSDLLDLSDPEQLVQAYCKNLLEKAAPFLKPST